MKTRASLSDKVLFNKEGLADSKAVYKNLLLLRSNDDLYACINNTDLECYSFIETDTVYPLFPSFGLKKAVKEKTDCTVTRIQELGKVLLNSKMLDYVQCSYLYLCDTEIYTKEEKNTKDLLWLNLDELLDYIVFKEYSNIRQIYRQALDKELLREYFKILKILR